jgi:hypothetical protein
MRYRLSCSTDLADELPSELTANVQAWYNQKAESTGGWEEELRSAVQRGKGL